MPDARADRYALDPRLARALREQLAQRQAALDAGARHVGWKLGMGERERIGGQIAIGYLTSASVLEHGEAYAAPAEAYAAPAGGLHADIEAAVRLGRDLAPAPDAGTAESAFERFGLALEIVDLARRAGEPESIVAGNVFHRAVRIVALAGAPTPGDEIRISVGGGVRAAGTWPSDLGERVMAATRTLAAVGERARAGDWFITGAIEQIPVRPGDEVAAELRDASASIHIAA